MIAVVERLAQDFRTVAPELIASPKQSLFRVYRDTRFSDNKKPLKTHAARDLPHAAAAEAAGRGTVFRDRAGAGSGLAAGCGGPSRPSWSGSASTSPTPGPRCATSRESAAFRRRFEELSGDTMTRVPRGYRADHPAAHYLKYRQFYGGAEFPASLAHSREFYPTLLATFKALMPLVRFLNEPLVGGRSPRAGRQMGHEISPDQLIDMSRRARAFRD